MLSDASSAKDSYVDYCIALSQAHSSYNSMINQKKALIEIATILSIVEIGWTIVTDINEMNGKKVDGIIEIIDNLRLKAPSELKKEDKK